MALVSGGAASTRGVREASFWETAVRLQLFVEVNLVDLEGFYESCRVAELGSLSSGAKMAMKIFVVLLQICKSNSVKYAIYTM